MPNIFKADGKIDETYVSEFNKTFKSQETTGKLIYGPLQTKFLQEALSLCIQCADIAEFRKIQLEHNQIQHLNAKFLALLNNLQNGTPASVNMVLQTLKSTISDYVIKTFARPSAFNLPDRSPIIFQAQPPRSPRPVEAKPSPRLNQKLPGGQSPLVFEPHPPSSPPPAAAEGRTQIENARTKKGKHRINS